MFFIEYVHLSSSKICITQAKPIKCFFSGIWILGGVTQSIEKGLELIQSHISMMKVKMGSW